MSAPSPARSWQWSWNSAQERATRRRTLENDSNRPDGRPPLARLPLRYELAIGQVRDYAIFMADPAGRAASWNEGVREVLGWDEESWIGQSATAIFPPEDHGAAIIELETARRTGRAGDDRWMMRRDGSRFFANGATTAIYEGDRLVGFLKVLRDQTAAHLHERALERHRSRLNLALEAAGAVCWDWDLETGTTERIGNLMESSGLSFSTVEDFLARVHTADQRRLRSAIDEARASGGRYAGDFRIIAGGGSERWVSVRGRFLFERGLASRMIGVALDITARVRAEADLRASREQSRVADRRKDEFLATLAHELRNPLASIATALEILRRSPAEAAVTDKARAIMERQLGHVLHLIEDLLDISRIGQGKLMLRRAPLVLQDVLSSAVETSRPSIEARRHTLAIDVPDTPLGVEGDATRLAQVFSNLLLNAAKFTEDGGAIALRASDVGSLAEVAVSDTGRGLAADEREVIFDMFSQVDSSTVVPALTGLGIGLALAKQIVELHGGSLAVASAGLGAGSTFTVRLPLTARAPGRTAGPETPRVDERKVQRRIIIADDNKDYAESLGQLLHLAGHHVSIATNGLEALQLIEQVRPDAVILDLGMPRLNGLEVARRVRENPIHKHLPLIATTGWGQEADRQHTADAGFTHHLVKPIDLGHLERILARIHDVHR